MKQNLPVSNTTLSKYIHSSATTRSRKAITVTIHIPDVVTENMKQEKINRIYDILNSKIPQ